MCNNNYVYFHFRKKIMHNIKSVRSKVTGGDKSSYRARRDVVMKGGS